jgi:proline iminopeptidase
MCSAVCAAAFMILTAPDSAEAQRARQGLVSMENARLFYEVIGEGEPIIVVHGGPGLDHTYLQPGLDALATRHTLVYYDQRGTGRSGASLDSETINIDTFVEDIEALRQTLGFERVSVLGHSFGSLIAMEYAFRHPETVRALILMNPVEPGTRYRTRTGERQRARQTAEDREELSELTQSEAFQARDAATLSQIYRIAFRQVLKDRDRVAELELDLQNSTARNGQDVAALLGGSLGEVDWWERIPEILSPTLILHGRYDAPPVDMSRELAETFPVGMLEVLDSGHFPYMEDREGLLSAVSGFFAGLR